MTGYIAQSVGNFGYAKTEAALNAPASDTFAVRVAGNYYTRDSFYDDLHLGNPPETSHLEPGNAESWGARIGVAWQPVSSVNLYLKYEVTKRDGDGFIGKDYTELAGANNALDNLAFRIHSRSATTSRAQTNTTCRGCRWSSTGTSTITSGFDP